MLLAALLAACAEPSAGPGSGGGADPGETIGGTSLPTVTGPDVPDEPAGPPTVSFVPEAMSSVPLMGGTLEPVPALGALLAADPEGNRIALVRPDGAPAAVVDLGENARPFRVVVADDVAWVTLRGAGELVRLRLSGTPSVEWRVQVCPEPRGAAHADDGAVVVACAGGEVLRVDGETGALLSLVVHDADLRDVVVADGLAYVSRFRRAEVLRLDPSTLARLGATPVGELGRVAWRMRAHPDGGVVVLFDEVSSRTLTASPEPGEPPAYGSNGLTCEALHQPTFGHVLPDGVFDPGASVPDVVLPVDFAITEDDRVWMISGAAGPTSVRSGLVELAVVPAVLNDGVCIGGTDHPTPADGQPAAVAVLDGTVYLQTAHRASVLAGDVALWDPGDPATASTDPFLVFHQDPGSVVACAACHAEGNDDGHVWDFDETVDAVTVAGPRKTLPLAGTITGRLPFHWLGEHASPEALVASTFGIRMRGPALSEEEVDALFTWLDGLRVSRGAPDADTATLALGADLFETRGCSGCHGGDLRTTNGFAAVRPGEPAYKVPTLLGVGLRASLMHDGCAVSITERLVGEWTCTGGNAHGAVTTLTPDEVEALAAYVRTL